MTDDTLKELVQKHDNEISLLANSIENQSKSIESLIVSNTETNKRLEEISKYLAKQALFDNKLEVMDREVAETFKRVHKRIDDIENTQESTIGCKSVQLLNKDVQSISKDTIQLVGTLKDTKNELRAVGKRIDDLPSSKILQWVIGLVIVYLVSFGSYVVSSLHTNEVRITKITEDIAK